MKLSTSEHAYLGSVMPDELGMLILELASQLHVERKRRIALEIALCRSGVLDADTLDLLATDADVEIKSQAQLDRAIGSLLRIITGSNDSRRPLRYDQSKL